MDFMVTTAELGREESLLPEIIGRLKKQVSCFFMDRKDHSWLSADLFLIVEK